MTKAKLRDNTGGLTSKAVADQLLWHQALHKLWIVRWGEMMPDMLQGERHDDVE